MSTTPSKVQATPAINEHIFLKVTKSRADFTKDSDAERHRMGRGKFSFLLDVIALQGAVYIPLSFASGKKPTGFIYQIEGTAEGFISTTDISCKGKGVTQVVLGTLRYIKIPKGATATFELEVRMEGSLNKKYKVVINRINYKLDPSDARYKKFDTDIASKVLTFK